MARTETEAEIEKTKILEERIKAPSIWGQLPCGIRFEDLQDTRSHEAVQLLGDNYLTEWVLQILCGECSEEEETATHVLLACLKFTAFRAKHLGTPRSLPEVVGNIRELLNFFKTRLEVKLRKIVVIDKPLQN